MFSPRTQKSHENKELALTDPIAFKEVISAFQIPAHSKMYKTIQLACESTNTVRQEIIFNSSTHPSANNYPEHEREALELKISRMRALGKLNVTDILGEQFDIADEKNQMTYIKIKADNIQAHGIGNCYEYCLMTYLIAQNKNKKIPIKICKFTKDHGDHVYLIFDPDESNPLKSFGNFGINAVCCDPLMGKIFPAKEIPQHIKAYKTIEENGKVMNVFVDFDPSEHTIEPLFPERPTTKVISQSQLFANTHQTESQLSENTKNKCIIL